uniref:PX domain-containing protein n=1 Tax=Panagrolaimus sp. JU765 TaxID=591449 RepID=A0AC34QNB3_9BILA
MSTLLPDESYCKSELGRILYSKRKGNAFSAAVTDQREVSGLFGHVEYDVVITIMPTDQIVNEAKKFKAIMPTDLIVNEAKKFKAVTRFKEMSKLHDQLATIHKQLYLKEAVPNFPSGMMWGANSPEVVQDRRKAIAALFNFAVKNEVLCKTKVFQQTLDTFEEIIENLPPTNTETFPQSDLVAPVLGELDIGAVELEVPAGEICEKRGSTVSGPEELTENEEKVVH